MLFSIITPSFRQLDWLGLCTASVADQGVEVEHLIQDAGSPGIEDWITVHPKAQVMIESDEGMYDAINRGLKRAHGDICAYLNCDEQYLPRTLQKVGDYFERHPRVDVLFGDAILADASLKPLAYRRAIRPLRGHLLLRPLGVLTCSIFFRRRVIDEGMFFDASWKIIGDKAWVLQLLDHGYTIGILNEPLAVFAFTGVNMSHLETASSERLRWEQQQNLSPAFRLLRPAAQLHHVWRKWRAGAYRHFTKDLSYYCWDNPSGRTTFTHLSLVPSWPRLS